MSATPEASLGALARRLAARQANNLLVILVTLWAGSIWTVGFIVAPALFELIGDRALAGSIAGRLFHTVHWIGLVAGAYLLLHAFVCIGRASLRQRPVLIALAMMLITLVAAFWIQPLIADLRADMLMRPELREQFATWHGVSGGLYALQSVLSVLLVVATGRRQY